MPTRHPRAARMVSGLIVALALSLVTTGCLTGNVGLKVNKDGSGDVSIEVFPSDELQKTLVESGAADVAKTAVAKVDDATFERKVTDGRISYKVKIPFEDYKDLGPLISSGIQLNGRSVRLFESFELTQPEEGQWRLRAELAQELLAEDFTSGESVEDLLASEGKVYLNNDLRLSIALPGRIIRSNAPEVDGGKGVWHLRSLEKEQGMSVVMYTEPKPLLTFVQKVLIGSGLAVFVGIILVVFGSQYAWTHKNSDKSMDKAEKKRRKKMKFPGRRDGENNWEAPAAAAGASGGRGFDSLPGVPAEAGPLRDPGYTDLPPVVPPVAPVVDPNQPNPFAPHRPGAPIPGVPAEAGPLSDPGYTDLPPVGPPVAPVVDPNQPNPFAPHRPGAPIPGVPAEAGPLGDPGYTDLPPVGPPVAPVVDPNQPNPFAPHRPGAPIPVHDVPDVDQLIQKAEEATMDHIAHYGTADPAHELHSLEHKAEEAVPGHPQHAVDPAHEMHSLEDKAEAADHEAAPFAPPAAGAQVPGPAAPAAHEPAPAPAVSFAPAGPAAPADPVPEPAPAVFDAPEPAPAPLASELDADFETAEPEPSWFKTSQDPVAQPEGQASEVPMAAPAPEAIEYPDVTADDVELPEADPNAALAAYPDVTASEPEPALLADAPVAPEAGPGADPDGGVPADWYPDPDDASRFRWWDGQNWTDFVS